MFKLILIKYRDLKSWKKYRPIAYVFCYWANYSLFQKNCITAQQPHLVPLASMDSGTMRVCHKSE